jgi:hypothetical protein
MMASLSHVEGEPRRAGATGGKLHLGERMRHALAGRASAGGARPFVRVLAGSIRTLRRAVERALRLGANRRSMRTSASGCATSMRSAAASS